MCQSEFCPGLWIKSCGLVNYCTIRSIVKIKMVLKVVFGTFRPIVNRKKRAMYKVGTARDAEKRAAGGRQLLVPGHLRASWFNRHPQMRLTPGHPESAHCQESFLNPPALYTGDSLALAHDDSRPVRIAESQPALKVSFNRPRPRSQPALYSVFCNCCAL